MTTVSNQINDVINNIADKLGATAELLAPEYARYVVAERTVYAIGWSVVAIVALIAFFVAVHGKFSGAYGSWEEVCETSMFVFALVCIVAIVLAVCAISHIAKANASPAALLMEYILKNVR